MASSSKKSKKEQTFSNLAPKSLITSLFISALLFSIFGVRDLVFEESHQFALLILTMFFMTGLCLSFFWRRLNPSILKTLCWSGYLFFVWTYFVSHAILSHVPQLTMAVVNFYGLGGTVLTGFLLILTWLQSSADDASAIAGGIAGLSLAGIFMFQIWNEGQFSAIIHDFGENQGFKVSASDYIDQPTDPGEPHELRKPSAHKELWKESKKASATNTMSLAAKSMPTPKQSSETRAKYNSKISHEWQYQGPKGPSYWAKLSPKYQLCQRGKEQSPINIPQHWEIQNHLQPFYQPSRFSVIDNGWAVQVEVEKGQEVYLNGKPFHLKKVEFHSPSEHFLNGRGFPMEIQMIHQNRSGELAIVAVFVEEGRPNQTVETLWRYLPKSVGNAVSPKSTQFNPRQLMPQKLEVYHYYGSLTRPPCHENIYWNILREPLELSHKQIEQFREKYRYNARPIQALNAR